LRRRRPDLDRGYFVPFFPWPAVIGILTNIALAAFLAIEIGRVGLLSIGWIATGMFLYWGYFKDKEETERPKEVLHQEALVSVDYSVLVPVSDETQAEVIGRLGSIIAKQRNGEVLALHVIKVPPQLQLSDGRLFLKEGRPYLEEVITQAKKLDVPVHTMIRLGRSIHEAILKTAAENSSDLILFGWPGYTGSRDQLFGSVIDRIVANPPTDLGIVRYRPYDKLERILVPVAGGPNGRLAVTLAMALAQNTPGKARIVLAYVVTPEMDQTEAMARAQNAFRRSVEGLSFDFDEEIFQASTPVEGILEAAETCDMVVIGATNRERLWQNLLAGNVSQSVADEAKCPVIIVKRRSTMIASFLRETVLEPVRQSEKMKKSS
ncbi:MAG: universal stress protein, partial [Candidatus Promineifilaceae bacterium]